MNRSYSQLRRHAPDPDPFPFITTATSCLNFLRAVPVKAANPGRTLNSPFPKFQRSSVAVRIPASFNRLGLLLYLLSNANLSTLIVVYCCRLTIGSNFGFGIRQRCPSKPGRVPPPGAVLSTYQPELALDRQPPPTTRRASSATHH